MKLALLICVLAASTVAHAATFTVTSLSDAGAGSLRQAIIDANAGAGADDIVFQTGLTGTISLQSALPAITGDLTITGPGAALLTVSRGIAGQIRIFDISGDVVMTGLTVQDGYAPGMMPPGESGGGILVRTGASLDISDCVIADCETFASTGGGIEVWGTLTMARCTISGCTGSSGGALTVRGGTATVSDSTFTGNSNGAVLAVSSLAATTLNLTNCTISGNSNAQTRGAANAYDDGAPCTLTLVNCTVTGNSTTETDGGGVAGINGSPVINLRNTIVAGNTSGNATDLSGTITSQGGNLIGNADNATITATTNDQFGTTALPVDAMLDALADYSGPTQTHRPQAGSPALNTALVAGSPTEDQRGVTRDATPDKGAFELAPALGVTGGPLVFATTAVGATSAEQQFVVTQRDITGNVTVTPPTHFEVSLTSGSGFAATPLNFAATYAGTTIYVRYAPTAKGTHASAITISATGATAATANVSGSTPASKDDDEEDESCSTSETSQAWLAMLGLLAAISIGARLKRAR